MSIKAIETEYKGYKFRSRLEARWAVFFDSAGIPWEYEKEGYELNTKERYLPDFYLPEQELFVEIKGEDPSAEYANKLARFALELEKSILIICGLPEIEKKIMFNAHLIFLNEKKDIVDWTLCAIFLNPLTPGALWTCTKNCNDEIKYLNGKKNKTTFRLEDAEKYDYLSRIAFVAMTNLTKESIKAMKQARFEFQQNLKAIPDKKKTKKVVRKRRPLQLQNENIEKQALAYMMKSRDSFKEIKKKINLFWVLEHQALYNKLKEYYKEHSEMNSNEFLSFIENDALRRFIVDIEMIPTKEKLDEAKLNEYEMIANKYSLETKVEMKEIHLEMAKESYPQDVPEIMEELNQLKKRLD